MVRLAANLKLLLEEGRAGQGFRLPWNQNAFPCGPDKITGPPSRQRSDFPRNRALAPLATRRHAGDQALKPDSIPGMRTHPSSDQTWALPVRLPQVPAVAAGP